MHEGARKVVVRIECPYCLEEVKEAAVVCSHCGRDLLASKLGPTLEKVSGLEKRLSSLEKQLSLPETRASEPGPSQSKQNTHEQNNVVEDVLEHLHIWFWLAALFCGVVPVMAYLLLDYVHAFWVSFIILLLPLAVGFEAGFYVSGRHWRDYVVSGIFVGLLSAFELWAIFQVQAETPQVWTKRDAAAVASGLAVAALFISGVLFGDMFETRTGPSTRKSAAASAAAKVVSPGAEEPGPRTSMLIQLLETLGPATIGAFGTIITAILSFYFTTRAVP
jgi:VIT1/CCC1 family predicted Fe2+/Mn2+ transporter